MGAVALVDRLRAGRRGGTLARPRDAVVVGGVTDGGGAGPEETL